MIFMFFESQHDKNWNEISVYLVYFCLIVHALTVCFQQCISSAKELLQWKKSMMNWVISERRCEWVSRSNSVNSALIARGWSHNRVKCPSTSVRRRSRVHGVSGVWPQHRQRIDTQTVRIMVTRRRLSFHRALAITASSIHLYNGVSRLKGLREIAS